MHSVLRFTARGPLLPSYYNSIRASDLLSDTVYLPGRHTSPYIATLHILCLISPSITTLSITGYLANQIADDII